MKWQDTIANECRYGDIAEQIWGDADVIWENSEADYQGHATFLAKQADGKFVFYEWVYGSCSGCDDWEYRNLIDEQIKQEMLQDAIFFDTEEELLKFLMLPEEKWKRSGGPMVGGITGMSDWLGGGPLHRLTEAKEAFLKWKEGE